jgi:hypothetical protein
MPISEYRPRWLPPAALDASLLADWQALEDSALEGNCFLSPSFVLPALRHLGLGRAPELLLIELWRGGVRAELCGLALLESTGPSRDLPWPHRRAWRSVHSFSSGVLLHREHAPAVLRALVLELRAESPNSGALYLENLRCDGATARLARPLLRESGMHWVSISNGQRAALIPPEAPERAPTSASTSASAPAALHPQASGPRAHLRRNLRRDERLLAREGTVAFRVLRGREIDAACIERHLSLEHSGWKGSAGTSLLAQPGHADFFREMAAAFAARDRILLCELLVGDEVVASTSNFISGSDCSAFKVGWSPRFARCAPGLLVDHRLMQSASTALHGLRQLDSCAPSGSYLEKMWPGRIEIARGFLAWGQATRLVLGATGLLRRAKGALWRRPRRLNWPAAAPRPAPAIAPVRSAPGSARAPESRA